MSVRPVACGPRLRTVAVTVAVAPRATVVGTAIDTARFARAGPATVTLRTYAVPKPPGVVAVTVAGPAALPARGIGDVATPLDLVVAIAELTPPGKDTEPVVTVKVAGTPGTALPKGSVTDALSGYPNAVAVAAAWFPRLVAVIVAGAPGSTTRAVVAEDSPFVALTV